MKYVLATLAVLAASICGSNALTDRQIADQVTDYCTSIGHPANVSHSYTMDGDVWIQVYITDTDLVESGRGKEVTDQVMWYVADFDEVWQVGVYAMCEEGVEGTCTPAYSSWRRGTGQMA
ncbi:MAG: exported protein of unknown function [Methanothrix sp.]|jgi:hypothetical protein|nr:MAG: exported protein of unknown function [Methanothrix sp.]